MIYDILVVGAGPAGSTFARLISNKYKKVGIIDGQEENKSKPCGGLLSTDAQKILKKMELTLPEYVLVNPKLKLVKTIDIEKGLVCNYRKNYINMDRYAFDKWLLSLVPKNIDIINGLCIKILKEDNIYSLSVKINGEIKVLKTRYLVGADGGSSLVRRTFYKNDIKKYTAIQQWFNYNQDEKFYSCIFDSKTSESCSWSLIKEGYFIYGGCFKSKNCREKFDEQKKRTQGILGFTLDNPIKTEACITLSPEKFSDFKTHLENTFLIGEAGGFISPSSYEGISYALITGGLLASAFNKCDNSNKIGSYYNKSLFKTKLRLIIKAFKARLLFSQKIRYYILKSKFLSVNK